MLNKVVDRLVDVQYHCNKQGININTISLNEDLRKCYTAIHGSNRLLMEYPLYNKREKEKYDWCYERIFDIVDMLALQLSQERYKKKNEIIGWLRYFKKKNVDKK